MVRHGVDHAPARVAVTKRTVRFIAAAVAVAVAVTLAVGGCAHGSSPATVRTVTQGDVQVDVPAKWPTITVAADRFLCELNRTDADTPRVVLPDPPVIPDRTVCGLSAGSTPAVGVARLRNAPGRPDDAHPIAVHGLHGWRRSVRSGTEVVLPADRVLVAVIGMPARDADRIVGSIRPLR